MQFEQLEQREKTGSGFPPNIRLSIDQGEKSQVFHTTSPDQALYTLPKRSCKLVPKPHCWLAFALARVSSSFRSLLACTRFATWVPNSDT